jgi:hypothetical protein
MIKWFRSIKAALNMASRLALIESELNEIDIKIQERMIHYSNEFERKIRQMSFAYTKNLDDYKSDYLKKYLEVRMDCIQKQVDEFPKEIEKIQSNYDKLMIGNDDKVID